MPVSSGTGGPIGRLCKSKPERPDLSMEEKSEDREGNGLPLSFMNWPVWIGFVPGP